MPKLIWVYTINNLGIDPNETFDPLSAPQYNSDEKKVNYGKTQIKLGVYLNSKFELWYMPKLIMVYTLIRFLN